MPEGSRAKAYKLRQLNKDELLEKLKEYQQTLASLRVEQVVSGNPSKVSQIKTFRKNIAVVKTVLTANQRTALKEHYKGAKYVPIDLRAKKTRAIRRQLNKHERSQTTLRQQKRKMYTTPRVYALKA